MKKISAKATFVVDILLNPLVRVVFSLRVLELLHDWLGDTTYFLGGDNAWTSLSVGDSARRPRRQRTIWLLQQQQVSERR